MKLDRHKFSIVLMSASLVLLASFLMLFLKKTWNDEVLAMKKETGFLFVNSIRGIEGKMMDRIITHNFIGGPGDSIREQFIFRMPNPPGGDSLKIMTLVNEGKFLREERDTNVEIRVSASQVGKSENEMAGSLSMIVAMTSKNGETDSVSFATNHPQMLAMLDSNFTASMRNSKLPIGFKIVNTKNDTLTGANWVRSGSYTDLASGESYAAELSNYRGYIFRKILPELLFSLLLFGCVAGAFFVVFKNLQAQRRLTELKNDFIQNVTHELKTPIATVGVAIEALRNFDAMQNPARTQEYLDISKSELNRLSLLVDKVLRMSHFEENELVLHLEQVDFQAIVSEVLASMKLQFENQNALMTFEASGESFMLKGDRLHLTSVVYNLLDNALKYSPGQPEIGVRLFCKANEIKLEVADKGIGIAPEHRERIFEKFYRVPTGNVHNAKGHGLGLSYVASVVRQHGGRVSVEEREGDGAVFIIALNSMTGI